MARWRLRAIRALHQSFQSGQAGGIAVCVVVVFVSACAHQGSETAERLTGVSTKDDSSRVTTSSTAQTAVFEPPPDYLVETRDAIFATTVRRISDAAAFGGAIQSIRHEYAKTQTWNADGSLILLGYRYPAALVDGKTFAFVRWVRQPSSAVWSNKDPHIAYGTVAGTNEFVSADLIVGQDYSLIYRFGEYERINLGAGEGNLSNDDRFAAIFGFSANGNVDLLVFDIELRRVVSRTSFGNVQVCDCDAPLSINNATMSQSGNYVVVQYNERGAGRFKGVEVFDRNLSFVRQVTPGSEHGDVGMTGDNKDVWVAWHDTTGHDPNQNASAYAWRLDTDQAIAVIQKGTSLGHISCRNIKRPGYCYASHGRSLPASLADDQAYAFPLDGSMNNEGFAIEHATASSYERYPMASPSRDGSQVLWASDWGNPAASVYAYVASK